MSKEAYGYTIASKGERFIATLVEGIIFGILFIVFYLIFGGSIRGLMEDNFDAMEVVYSAVSGIVVGAIFYPLFSGNLGHRIFNLKVISAETGADFNKAENGAIRECLKSVLCYLIIPVIWILWDKNNQNLYDKLTKTLVVYK
jgi:uncharacterized RDD family membrane protein YckC